ncbi:MAG: outer membrane protein assembly factor BamB family protein [Solirubrobacteraceae bacterium]
MSKLGCLVRACTLIAMSVLAGAVLFIQAATAKPTAAAQTSVTGSSLDWPQYLNGPQHSSVSATTAFTVSNAASATQAWHWPPAGQTAPTLDASPTVVGGTLYIGDQSSHFWAVNESTGHKVWEHTLDPPEPATTCQTGREISSTAAVLPDPVTGTSTVYVSGPSYPFGR